MKNRKKLLLLIFTIVSTIFIITGCWNYREVNEIAIATGLAIDKDKESENYIVTVETISARGGQEMTMEPDVISAQGKTVFDGVRNIILKSGKKLYWSHAKVIIISEEIAKEGIVPALDFVSRDAEVRADIWILISLDKTAGDILQGKDKMHDTMSFHLDDLLKSQDNIPKFYAVDFLSFLDDLSEQGISATIPTTKMIKKWEEIVPEVYGTAIFKEDKMIGWIDGLETRSMLIVKDKIKDGVIVITNVAGTKTDVTLEIFNCKTKLKPITNGGNLSMKIDVKMEAGIGGIAGYDDVVSKDGRTKLKNQAQAAIKKEIIEVITKVQKQYKNDIFGFGNAIYRDDPQLWRTVKSDWENIFSELPVDISVEVTIKGSGLTSKPIKIGD
ncbi:Ger(x)C family spore germination protein [Brassicibacter mesophilus]|uniref:Ger(x)C family spore germination protein n=1 Tax=Brassicibacter mesophilus TaxID=745119 RepID=UPI003D260574